jgi:hypothetical protein
VLLLTAHLQAFGSGAAVLLLGVNFGGTIAICASQQRFAAAHFLPALTPRLQLLALGA